MHIGLHTAPPRHETPVIPGRPRHSTTNLFYSLFHQSQGSQSQAPDPLLLPLMFLLTLIPQLLAQCLDILTDSQILYQRELYVTLFPYINIVPYVKTNKNL